VSVAAAPGEVEIRERAPLRTWFRIGGGAERFAAPRDASELARCLEIDPGLRVIGDGANLLVDDEGVDGLVVDLGSEGSAFARVEPVDGRGLVRAGAGASLQKMIPEACRLGLGGIEGLAGIPASLGGALVMNAGGAFGEIADVVERVHALTRDGREITLERSEIAFGYRRSGLGGLLVTAAELRLTPGDPAALRARYQECNAYKRRTQPMTERSAGCCFKNPTLAADLEGVAPAGGRVSAGMLIDRAGCKGLSVGGATVSERHANFITTAKDARAADVIALMGEVRRRVFDAFGVVLEPEVVVWSRRPERLAVLHGHPGGGPGGRA